jgi:hypothetical protein
MFLRSTQRVIAFIVVASMVVCAVALAATTQTFSQKFATTHPKRATSLSVRWSASKQPKSVTLTFPQGLTWGQLSSNSKVGTGTATFGHNMPPRTITVYTTSSPGPGMTLVIANPVGLTVRVNAYFAHMGAQLVIPIPKFNIPPATLTGMSLTLKGGSTSHPFVRTPSTCPSSKGWRSMASIAYPTGASKVLISTSACVKH